MVYPAFLNLNSRTKRLATILLLVIIVFSSYLKAQVSNPPIPAEWE